LISYQIDHGKFPTCPTPTEWCILDEIDDELIGAGLSSIPTDPTANRIISDGIEGAPFTAWQYAYIPIKKRWIDNNGFVLMAATETEWWSNRVAGNDIQISDEYTTISAATCKEFWPNTTCTYTQADDELRYIYVY
jgi:hypothetical protein